jgi:hypothetical protein
MNTTKEISVFESYRNPVPGAIVPIETFVNDVLGETFKNEVEEIRAENDKTKRDRMKSYLPAVTISGTFTRRGNANLIKHSGYICIDIDTKPDGITWAELRDITGKWDTVYFAALSVSGNGLFLIIPIVNPAKHHQHFDAIKIEFEQMGITIDTACRDIARLRGVSYDPAGVFNPDARRYDLIYEPPEPRQIKRCGRIESDKLNAWVERKGLTFIPGQRHEFIKQKAGAYHRLGISQFEAERVLMQYQQSDFTKKEIQKIIEYMYNNQAWVQN